ncbi:MULTISPECIES: hypothetical protein [Mycobacterium]|uniref:hypothetical protein n=1 Tax=Mycobacterium TaxID=1763 RepID=UPI0007FE4D58|nr:MULTISPECIES: hypothetical protein [Mycobacterium]OBG62581.1 hypothetical protein A5703_21035 [Mycobacterium sp. E188]OBH35928.1 hypothetical protein A5691_05895 [Mycobacterium sp. E183]OBH81479.1 hypothetical protein A5681_25515 [Mycobacterium scrofulaceum]
MEGDCGGRSPGNPQSSKRSVGSGDVGANEVEATIPVDDHSAQTNRHKGITRSDIDALAQLKSLRKAL